MAKHKCLHSYLIRHLFYLLAILTCINTISALNSEETSKGASEEILVRKPRFIRIFSRRSEDDKEVESGRPLRDHLGNALEGGTIGIELGFKPIKERIKGIYRTFREFFPRRQNKKSTWGAKPVESPKGKDNDIDKNGQDDDKFEPPRDPRFLPEDPPKGNDVDDSEFDNDMAYVDVDPRVKLPVPGFLEREREMQ